MSPRPRRVYGGHVFFWRRHSEGVTRRRHRPVGRSEHRRVCRPQPRRARRGRPRPGRGEPAPARGRARARPRPARLHGPVPRVGGRRRRGPPGRPPRVDALVTTVPNLALAALVADCTPVLLADPQAGVVGAVHAGRPGMVAGVVPRAVEAMRDLGARTLSAVVGPSICARCYEVPLAMREDVAAVVPESRAVSWTGTPALDVAAGVVAQLAGGRRRRGVDRGLPAGGRGACTPTVETGRPGRYAGVIVQERPMSDQLTGAARRAQLAAGLESVGARIDAALRSSGRSGPAGAHRRDEVLPRLRCRPPRRARRRATSGRTATRRRSAKFAEVRHRRRPDPRTSSASSRRNKARSVVAVCRRRPVRRPAAARQRPRPRRRGRAAPARRARPGRPRRRARPGRGARRRGGGPRGRRRGEPPPSTCAGSWRSRRSGPTLGPHSPGSARSRTGVRRTIRTRHGSPRG